MEYLIEFTSIIEENGKRFLFDEHLAASRCAQVDALESDLEAIQDLLKESGLPCHEESVMAIATNGSPGLESVVEKDALEQAKKTGLSDFIRGNIIRLALSSVPDEVREKADELHRNAARDLNGLPVMPKDYIWHNGRILDADAIKAKIAAGCRREITKEDAKIGVKILDLAKQIRALEMAGINGMELVGKYLRADEHPADLALYRDIATRRHLPGVVLPATQVADIVKRLNELSKGGQL